MACIVSHLLDELWLNVTTHAGETVTLSRQPSAVFGIRSYAMYVTLRETNLDQMHWQIHGLKCLKAVQKMERRLEYWDCEMIYALKDIFICMTMTAALPAPSFLPHLSTFSFFSLRFPLYALLLVDHYEVIIYSNVMICSLLLSTIQWLWCRCVGAWQLCCSYNKKRPVYKNNQ